jgi:hypothetical protein
MLWFAQGSASYRKHFRPSSSRATSRAATRASPALQKRWNRLRAGMEPILDQRGADMVDVPGGARGILCRDYKGSEEPDWVWGLNRSRQRKTGLPSQGRILRDSETCVGSDFILATEFVEVNGVCTKRRSCLLH